MRSRNYRGSVLLSRRRWHPQKCSPRLCVSKLPSDGIWGLPVVVHEYGHFVASVLQSREDIGGMPEGVVLVERRLFAKANEEELPRLYWHGHELFADAFATAVTGPAHAEYCIRYRFDPFQAHESPPPHSHPTPARRMRIQFAVLDTLAMADDSGYLAQDVGTLAYVLVGSPRSC